MRPPDSATPDNPNVFLTSLQRALAWGRKNSM
jgi:hypothetical protein